MIEALHHGTTWAWMILAAVATLVVPRILAWIVNAGYYAAQAITHYGGKLVLVGVVVAAVYFGAKAVV